MNVKCYRIERPDEICFVMVCMTRESLEKAKRDFPECSPENEIPVSSWGHAAYTGECWFIM